MDWVRLGTVISYVMSVMFNVTMKLSNVSKNNNKRTAKCDKSMVSCNIDTAQCNPEKVLL